MYKYSRIRIVLHVAKRVTANGDRLRRRRWRRWFHHWIVCNTPNAHRDNHTHNIVVVRSLRCRFDNLLHPFDFGNNPTWCRMQSGREPSTITSSRFMFISVGVQFYRCFAYRKHVHFKKITMMISLNDQLYARNDQFYLVKWIQLSMISISPISSFNLKIPKQYW